MQSMEILSHDFSIGAHISQATSINLNKRKLDSTFSFSFFPQACRAKSIMEIECRGEISFFPYRFSRSLPVKWKFWAYFCMRKEAPNETQNSHPYKLHRNQPSNFWKGSKARNEIFRSQGLSLASSSSGSPRNDCDVCPRERMKMFATKWHSRMHDSIWWNMFSKAHIALSYSHGTQWTTKLWASQLNKNL